MGEQQAQQLYYAAYGSNASKRRMLSRVPDAEYIDLYEILGWKLAMNKRSVDGSAKANVVPAEDSAIFVTLYKVSEEAAERLDVFEGAAKRHYKRVNVTVGDYEAFMYVAVHTDENVSPFCWYINYVISGLIEAGVDANGGYIDEILSIRCVEDPDAERKAFKLAEAQNDYNAVKALFPADSATFNLIDYYTIAMLLREHVINNRYFSLDIEEKYTCAVNFAGAVNLKYSVAVQVDAEALALTNVLKTVAETLIAAGKYEGEVDEFYHTVYLIASSKMYLAAWKDMEKVLAPPFKDAPSNLACANRVYRYFKCFAAHVLTDNVPLSVEQVKAAIGTHKSFNKAFNAVASSL